MSGGPRISSGSESKQDYQTDPAFLTAVRSRFGEVTVDLAAHACNHVAAKYYAPAEFEPAIIRGETDLPALVEALTRQGALEHEAHAAVHGILWSLVPVKKGKQTTTIRVKNRDLKAAAFDSFKQSWSANRGLQFLNPEFADIGPWAARCAEEAQDGARVGLLVPATVGSNWFRDHVAPFASVYLLNGRLCFDGKNGFPKDCIWAVFDISVPTSIQIWDWKSNILHKAWK